MKHIENGQEKASKDLESLGYKHILKEMSKSVEGLLLKGDRLIIPKSLIANVLAAAHEGHPGREFMTKQLRESAWWLGMTQDIKDFVMSCKACRGMCR